MIDVSQPLEIRAAGISKPVTYVTTLTENGIIIVRNHSGCLLEFRPDGTRIGGSSLLHNTPFPPDRRECHIAIYQLGECVSTMTFQRLEMLHKYFQSMPGRLLLIKTVGYTVEGNAQSGYTAK